jgi:hypothetical protein
MCLKNLATNTLIPTVLRPLQEPAEPSPRMTAVILQLFVSGPHA